MSIDENATQYVYGNGRFDLMTDEEVRTITSDDLHGILMRLAHFRHQGDSSVGEECYHRLEELRHRYPYSDFRLEVIPPAQPTQESME